MTHTFFKYFKIRNYSLSNSNISVYNVMIVQIFISYYLKGSTNVLKILVNIYNTIFFWLLLQYIKRKYKNERETKENIYTKIYNPKKKHCNIKRRVILTKVFLRTLVINLKKEIIYKFHVNKFFF